MDAEHSSLMYNVTWTLVPRLHGRNVVSCKWVYNFKEEKTADGSLFVRYNACLVIARLLTDRGN